MSSQQSTSNLPPGQALPAGARLEEFVIERVLGSGGFGITYLARDSRLGRQVVIKENLPAQFCWRDTTSLTVQPRHSQGEDADNFQYSLESFKREAATLASLDHPGIVKVLRSFEANGTAYFVMPFVEGTPLDEAIRLWHQAGQPISEQEILGLLSRLLDALGYLHERGIYHRDIKPGNILLTSTGEPVLIDFGAARQRLSERSLTVIESAGYTPFEQMQSRGNVGPWSDLYALGATLYKAISAETPAKAADRAFDDPVIPLVSKPELRRCYSETLLTSIDKALAPRPQDRHQSAIQWLDALRLLALAIQNGHDIQNPIMVQAERLSKNGPVSANNASNGVDDPGLFGKDPAALKARPVKLLTSALASLFCAIAITMVFKNKHDSDQNASSHDESQAKAIRTAQILVAADREGAAVYWSDKKLGETPVNVALPPGSHTLQVLRPPWEARNVLIQVGDDGRAIPQEASVSFPPAKLQVTSNQSSVAIWLEGKLLGTAPTTLELEPGSHEIELRLQGWPSKKLSIRANSDGSSTPPSWDSNFEPGMLKIEAIPDGVEASVSYNRGRPSEWVPVPIATSLPPGHVSVRYRKDGHEDFEAEGLIEEAKELILKASLTPSHPLNHGKQKSIYAVSLPGNAKMDFCYCPPGPYIMGTKTIGYGNWQLPVKGIDDENPVEVEISKGFWIGRTEVTQEQWTTLMPNNPSKFKGKNLPVENINFSDTQNFIEALNQRIELPLDWKFSIPTEANWEYACRAGSTTSFSFGDSLTSDQANFNGDKMIFQSRGKYLAKTVSVGKYPPNDWGIHDMHGNVAEWCSDWYANRLSGGTDPDGPRFGTERVIRGGSWWVYNGACRSARRDNRPPSTRSLDLGIRVAIVR